jgi:hypothetical protein
MTSTELSCNWPESYLHVTQNLLDDQRKHQRFAVYNEIIKDLESELYANKGEDLYYATAIESLIDRLKSKVA